MPTVRKLTPAEISDQNTQESTLTIATLDVPDAVKAVLTKINIGILTVNKSSFNDQSFESVVESQLIKLNVRYIAQPNGTQSPPDFRLFIDNHEYNLELKSSKNGYAMWNSSLPVENTIYFYVNTKDNTRAVFLGRDIMSIAETELLLEYSAKYNQLAAEYNARLQDSAWSVYPRKMFENRKRLA